jgi:hypothetical protein
MKEFEIFLEKHSGKKWTCNLEYSGSKSVWL